MHFSRTSSYSGFTLIELALVVLVISLLSAAALRYASATSLSNNISATNYTLDTLETALMNYRVMFNRLPCPASITAAENTAAFGVEDDYTYGPDSGTCSPQSSTDDILFNTATPDPDDATGSDNNYGGSADPLFNTAVYGQVAAGGVPTKTLHIDDRYAYDSWGRKILYAVDIRATRSSAFSVYSISNNTIGAIVVKPTSQGNNSTTSPNTLGNALTYKGVYALVSFGPNGHGGYMRNPNNTPIIVNAGSTNPDELNNCHCTSASVATSFYRIFVQKNATPAAQTTTGNSIAASGFDDIVRFKTRSQLASQSELQ